MNIKGLEGQVGNVRFSEEEGMVAAVYALLETEGMAYDRVDHPVVYTVEEADAYIEGMTGGRTKSLFLTNRKKTAYYLVVMEGSKRLDWAALAEVLEVGRLSFASPDLLQKKMGLSPGGVSLFGLLNNPEKDIQVWLDRSLLSHERLVLHPNCQTQTLFVGTEAILSLIGKLGFSYQLLDL